MELGNIWNVLYELNQIRNKWKILLSEAKSTDKCISEEMRDNEIEN